MVNVGNALRSGAATRGEFGEEDITESYFEENIERVTARTVNIRADKNNYHTDGVFILGNSDFGVLGTNELGSGVEGVDWTGSRIIENKMWVDYDETFDATTYQDSSTTTVAGWGTGSVVFSALSTTGTTTTTIDLSSGAVSNDVVQSTGSLELS